MGKKALYIPTGQMTVILNEKNEYCEILLNEDFKNVPKTDLKTIITQNTLSTLEDLKENIFLNCLKNPLSDILYSYNTNRLTPEPHQYKPLIKFLDSKNNRILIADEVGLGKTIEAGMIYKEIDKREELKVSLIVVPSSLTHKWKEEFAIRFDEHFDTYKTNQFLNFIDEYERFNTSKLIHEKIIISYHTLRDERVMKKLENGFFEVDFLIMDEAHTMRNFGTSTYKSAKFITSISEHIVFLTATPVQNSLDDLFNILSLLDNDYFKEFDYFQKMLKPNQVLHRLIALIRNNNHLSDIKKFIQEHYDDSYPALLKDLFDELINTDSISNHQKINFIDKLTKIDHLSFILNRTKKKDVGLITPRSAKSVIVDITKEEREYYEAVIRFVMFLYPHLPQGFITIMPERLASSSMVASLESFKEFRKSGKIFFKDFDELEDYHEDMDIKKEAIKYLDNVVRKGELIGDKDSKFLQLDKIIKDLQTQNIKQMIVFSFFKKTLDYLEIKLKDLGYSVGKIHGDFSTEERFSKINDFRKGKFDILLSSEVGSEGLDMQFCNVVINYDLPWNPMRVEQRIGRIDRIGQKFDKLHIFNLCIEGSIEDRIFNRLYMKLNIFEESIGELEPILGNLEKELKIVELINLSKDELDKKLSIEELASERKKREIAKTTKEFDKMLNDDFDFDRKHNSLLNPLKTDTLQQQSRQTIIEYLKENDIGFLELKDKSLKLSSQSIKKLFSKLKNSMSDKRKEPLKYKEEKKVLQKINRYNELKLKFNYDDKDDFQTIYIYLNHPILQIITKNKNYEVRYSTVSNNKYQNNFAVVYRVDFKQTKTKSYIKVVILDENYGFVDEVDYFEFINSCADAEEKADMDFEKVKAKATTFIIEEIEKQKIAEEREQNRLIDVKISSIKNYFKKQIEKTKRLQKKVQQEGIVRMRISEIENLQQQRDKKIKELESQKETNSSFEILGVLGVVG